MNYVARNCKCSAWVVTALGSDGVLVACCGAFTCLVLCSCGMLLELYSTRGWKQWVPFFCECYTVCYLPLLISLQTGQPASVCNAIPSLQREEKKKANWSLVVAEDLTVFYDVCNQPFTAHCSHLWRIFIFLWKRDQGPAVILAFVKPRMSLLTNPFQVLGHHILLTNAA